MSVEKFYFLFLNKKQNKTKTGTTRNFSQTKQHFKQSSFKVNGSIYTTNRTSNFVKCMKIISMKNAITLNLSFKEIAVIISQDHNYYQHLDFQKF